MQPGGAANAWCPHPPPAAPLAGAFPGRRPYRRGPSANGSPASLHIGFLLLIGGRVSVPLHRSRARIRRSSKALSTTSPGDLFRLSSNEEGGVTRKWAASVPASGEPRRIAVGRDIGGFFRALFRWPLRSHAVVAADEGAGGARSRASARDGDCLFFAPSSEPPPSKLDASGIMVHGLPHIPRELPRT